METSNVTSLREDDKLDLQEHQATLIEAEDAALNALEWCSRASVAFVSMVQESGVSVVQPGVRRLLKRIPETINRAAELSHDLSDCHIIAHNVVKGINHRQVVLTGGIPKDGFDPKDPG